MSALLPVYPRLALDLVRADGCWLTTSDGRRILDMYGAHAVCPLGHAHPELTEALTTAHRTLDFYSNSLHMAVQERAAEAVLGGSAHLSHVHFVNSGTEANESALHLARRVTGRQTVVTLAESFHGRTLGSLSVTGLSAYRGRVPLDVPASWHRMVALGDEDLSAIDHDVAAVLVESVVSLGGVRMPPDGWLSKVAARCAEVGALLVLDEVQGGVGRLGTWFGHETLGVRPDMVTLAKSLGGGFPVGALVVTPALAAKVTHSELGTTFGGGPMAAAMVETVARVIRRDGLMDRVLAIEARIRSRLAAHDDVAVRGRGALLGIVTPAPAKVVRDALLARDVIVGTSSDPHGLRLLHPYVLTDAEVDVFLDALQAVLAEVPRG
ncbi:MAG: aspartate aminotransferase family protein [Alphaproteobacteria bacterium]|nr:aspartate aminotransferase family protein [Alphaproteobacteria bacterium]